MGLQIIKKSDKRVVRAFTHKLADIPGGLTISAADIADGGLAEGSPVGIDSNGLGRVVKGAKVAAYDGTNKIVTVAKGHGFAVGDYLFAAVGGKSYEISSISDNASDSTKDDIVTATALGVAVGDVVYQGSASGASAGAFKFTPVGLTGEAVDKNENESVEVVTIGQVKAGLVPAAGAALKGVLKCINYI